MPPRPCHPALPAPSRRLLLPRRDLVPPWAGWHGFSLPEPPGAGPRGHGGGQELDARLLLPPFQAFQVFERMARQDDERRHRELEAKLRKKEEEEEAAERVRVAPAAQEVEVETTVEPPGPAGEAAGLQDSAAPAAPSPAPVEPPGAAAPAQPQPAELPT